VIKEESQDNLLMLFDDFNLTICNLTSGSCRSIQGVQSQSALLIDDCYLYTLQGNSRQRQQGLRVWDLSQMRTAKDYQVRNFYLADALVGKFGLIDFSLSNQRICFQRSHRSFSIYPVLHRDTVGFYGMKQRSEYLATKQDKGSFIALEGKNKQVTWSLLSGKITNTFVDDAQDFSDYEVYATKHNDL